MVREVVVALLALGWSTASVAEQPRPERLDDGSVRLMIGEAAAQHVALVFSPEKGGAEAAVIETRQVGAPGARLTLRVDRSERPLIARVLDEEGCRFDDQGSLCRIVISGDERAYGSIITAFRAGLVAHVDIENAGLMVMSRSVSLRGFRRAYCRRNC